MLATARSTANSNVSPHETIGTDPRHPSHRSRVPRAAALALTIASTLQRMMADISMVGSDLTAMPLDATGVTLAIADVTLSGS